VGPQCVRKRERECVWEREGGRERGEGKTVTGYLKCPQNEWMVLLHHL